MSKDLDDIIRWLDQPIDLTPTDTMIAMLRDRAADFGFVLSGRCQHCQRPISALRSLRARSGPVCAAKHKEKPGEHAENLHTTDQ
jgi:hypothetical protein